MKRMRQETVRRARNRQVKDVLRTELKALSNAVVAGNKAKAGEQLQRAQSQLSRAVKKNLIHKNTAARKLAQLNTLAKSINAKVVPAAKKASAKPATKPKATPKPAATKKSTPKK